MRLSIKSSMCSLFCALTLSSCNPLMGGGDRSSIDADFLPTSPTSTKPSVSYVGSSGTSGSIGVAMSVAPTTLTENGAAITSCGVKPGTTALPSWANVDLATCVISGVPTEGLSATTYTIVATNTAGDSDDAYVQLSVGAIAPTTLTSNTPVSATGTNTTPTITVSGGDVASGVTVTLYSNSLCTLAVAGASGMASGASINLTASALADDSYTFYANLETGGITSSCSSSGVSYHLDTTAPTFADSFSLVAATSTSTTSAPAGTYTANASDGTGVGALVYQYSIGTTSGGTQVLDWTTTGGTPFTASGLSLSVGTTYYMNLRVIDALLNASSVHTEFWQVISTPSLSYASSTGMTGTRSVAMSVTPSALSAGASATVSSCAITAGGSLPTGVTINNSTCVISGTPSTLLAPTAFTVTITNSFSQTTTANVTLEVNEDWSDNDNSAAVGFSGGSHTGSSYDTTNSYLRLTQTGTPTNNSSLDASWTPQWASIVGYWKLNETSTGTAPSGTDFQDVASTPHHATKSGTVTLGAAGRVGSAMSVAAAGRASTSSIDLLAPSGGSVTVDFTMAMWVNPASSQVSYADIITHGHCNSTNFTIEGNAGGTNVFAAGYRTGSGAWATGGSFGTLTSGVWSYLTFTKIGTQSTAYVNGVQVAQNTEAVATMNLTTRQLDIGGNSAVCGTRYFNGSIDDVAIWNTGLTASEVQTIYSRQSAKYAGQYTSRVFDALGANSWDGFKWLTTLPFGKELTGDANNSGTITSADSETSTDYSSISTNTLMNGMVGLWHLNETSVTAGANNDFSDSSGNARAFEAGTSMTLNHNCLFSTCPLFASSAVANALNTSSGFAINSISLWIRKRNNSQSGILHVGAMFNQNYYIYSYQPNFVDTSPGNFDDNSYGVCVVVSNNTACTPYNSIVDNGWHHIVFSWNGGTSVYLAIDGTLPSLYRPAGGGVWNASAQPMVLGSTPVIDNTQTNVIGGVKWLGFGNLTMAGNIDEVAAWNRVLSTTEILELYRRGANRIKFQTRACTASDCSDNPTWLGPALVKAGTAAPYNYFSEIQNNTSLTASTGNPIGRVFVGFPELFFSWFSGFTVPNNRYFQYRTILESDDNGTGCNYGSGPTWCSPELQGVTISP